MQSATPFIELATLPTPIHLLEHLPPSGVPLWIKRDDLTSPRYGGNKVRTLEVLLGLAKRQGATLAVSTGAYGSNHALATAMHAAAAGLRPGALLFPQPPSQTASDNLRALAATADVVVSLPHWSALPAGIIALSWAERRRGRKPFVMVPGGATPVGALGYVSAAFELAHQIERSEMPCPARVVVGVGSTCTSAGLLLGLSLAARRGAFPGGQPHLVSARVTPWPVTSPFRIVRLALRTSRLLFDLTQDASVLCTPKELAAHLTVDGRYLGRGYGHATAEGRAAMDLFERSAGPPLDTTYSAKAAACALEGLGQPSGPTLFWATKSSAPLPRFDLERERALPRRMRRYLRDAATAGFYSPPEKPSSRR